MSETIEKALVLWNMAGAEFRLIAARENQVYRVDHDGKSYALRMHRAGYRTELELSSELSWMDAIGQGGINVPSPIPSASGEFLHIVDDIQLDVLTWLSGAPIGKSGETLESPDRIGVFFRIGREMAHLHAISDKWKPPEWFTRCAWDQDGLVGKSPVWGRFWDNPTLVESDRELMLRVRRVARGRLKDLESLDYGLIHADLIRENVMIEDDKLKLIDFDDGGFGFRLFDLATTLFNSLQEDDYASLRAALIEGYTSVRSIDLAELDLFILLRSATYVGWIITRMDEEGSENRNTQFINSARILAQAYLKKHNPGS